MEKQNKRMRSIGESKAGEKVLEINDFDSIVDEMKKYDEEREIVCWWF